MNTRSKPFLGGMVLALIGLTALTLVKVRGSHQLGAPGIKIRPLAGSARVEVLMPDSAPGFQFSLPLFY
jgi:hypothetical protein